MAVRILIADPDQETHGVAIRDLVKTTFNVLNGQVMSWLPDLTDADFEFTTSFSSAVTYALANESVLAIIYGYAGWASCLTMAKEVYPRVQCFMPMGSNLQEEITGYSITDSAIITVCGAGTESNIGGYGNGIEFWDDGGGSPLSLQSYACGVICGKLLFLKLQKSLTWWVTRWKCRAKSDKTETNRVWNLWDKYNGYGQIPTLIGEFIKTYVIDSYRGIIPLDPYIYTEAGYEALETTISEQEVEITGLEEDVAELEASDAIMSPYFDDTNIRTGFEDTGNAETEDVESSRISSFSFEDGIVNCKLKLYTDADTFAKDNTAYIAKIDGNEGLITLNNFLYNWVKNNTSRLTSLTFKTQTK